MPTGYTAILLEKNNVTFQEFALRCARAFGALVTMRDDPMDAAIPDEISTSNYHTEALGEARRKLLEFDAMSPAEREALAKRSIAEGIDRMKQSRRESEEQNAKFEAMIAEVEKWTPPTREHDGMKEFMIEQLRTSMTDTSGWYEKEISALENTSTAEWESNHKVLLLRNIDYHATNDQEERKRAAERTEWIRQLKGSLSVGVPR